MVFFLCSSVSCCLFCHFGKLHKALVGMCCSSWMISEGCFQRDLDQRVWNHLCSESRSGCIRLFINMGGGAVKIIVLWVFVAPASDSSLLWKYLFLFVVLFIIFMAFFPNPDIRWTNPEGQWLAWCCQILLNCLK